MNQSIQYLTSLSEVGDKSKNFLEKWGGFFPAIVFIYNLERREVSCVNSKLTDYLGYAASDLENLAHGFAALVYADDLPLVNSAIDKFDLLPNGESCIFTARFNHKDGGCRYLKCSCSKVQSNMVMITAENVTEQMRFEEEALSTRQLFDETEKLLLFGSWSWSPKTDKLEWTEGMYELLGYHEKDVGQVTNEFYLKHILPEHAEHFQLVVQQSVSSGMGFELEYVIRTKTGIEKFVFTKGKALLDKDGIVKKIIGITRDVTAKKNFEKERDRNIRELNRSNKELEEFAYVASHDLHEPLRKILTFSERLKGKFSDTVGSEGQVYLDRIWASAFGMRNLIDNLLEFSKISRGSRSFVECDLNRVINEVLSDQELRIEETSTEFRVQELATVEGVPSELRQLFNNLVGNALKFRKKDIKSVIHISGKRLTHKEKSDLLLPFNQVFFQVNVKDNGIGFESIYTERIFEIFQRLHGKAEYGGSGIGLAICKKIVDNHDGIIYATSSPGIGSTFSVILPEKQFH
jgi:PAS domain S-box-containing protein